MKNEKVDFTSGVVRGPIHPTIGVNLTIKKKKSARGSSCERSTKVAFGEITEICALLKADLLKDLEVCAKFVDGIGKVVDSGSFAKNMVYSCQNSLLVMMQKTGSSSRVHAC